MKERGFTLVELLTGLAVAAILLTIAIPGYAFLVNAGRMAAATNDLVSALHLARSEAVKRGVRVTVCKTGGSAAACDAAADWQRGWMVFVDGGARGVVDGSDTSLWVQDASPPGVGITSNNYSRYISYLPNGRSQGSNGLPNGTISLCLAGHRRNVVINWSGRPRLETGTC